MNELLGTIVSSPATAGDRNRVLRNTYWLLALSMIPTVLSAWVGISTGITRAMSPGVSLVVFLAGAAGLMFAIEKTKESAAGVFVLLGFTFFMGLMLARLLGAVLGLSNGAGWSSQDSVDTVATPPRSDLKLIRADAAEMTVATGSIVEGFDVVGDVLVRKIAVLVDVLLDPFLLQASEERLGNCIIPAVPFAAHARFELV